jgi:hypothetical protein
MFSAAWITAARSFFGKRGLVEVPKQYLHGFQDVARYVLWRNFSQRLQVLQLTSNSPTVIQVSRDKQLRNADPCVVFVALVMINPGRLLGALNERFTLATEQSTKNKALSTKPKPQSSNQSPRQSRAVRRPSRGRISLSAYRFFEGQRRSLPKLSTAGSQEEFRVFLAKGRLRCSFTVPSGFKLDPQNAIIRIKLYQAG